MGRRERYRARVPRSCTASASARKTARPTELSATCRSAKTSRWRFRRAAAGRGRFRARDQNALADQYIKALDIRTTDREKPIRLLSGGNQQKAILARWLATNPDFLILDEPTRGIDVGAHAEIIKLIEELCAKGMSLIVISSELEELVAYSSRVIVLRDRRAHRRT